MTIEYADRDVVVLEVNSAMTTQDELFDWSDGFDYYSFRTEPADLVETDYRKTLFMSAKVFLLIDLSSMKVIESNCGETFEGGEECIVDHL